jgi:DNA invertase Pin-like site-specific DNA recombinase
LNRGDIVVVWKLDRLSRSLKDLLLVLERLETIGAGCRSLTEAIDTTGPAGRMMMQMLGAFADDAVSAVMRSSAARTQELPGLFGVRCYA